MTRPGRLILVRSRGGSRPWLGREMDNPHLISAALPHCSECLGLTAGDPGAGGSHMRLVDAEAKLWTGVCNKNKNEAKWWQQQGVDPGEQR